MVDTRRSSTNCTSGLKRAHLNNGFRSSMTRAERFSAGTNHGNERLQNSIDRAEELTTQTLPLFPSTSANAINRRELLKRVYGSNSANASIKSDARLMIRPSAMTLLPLNLNRNLHNRELSAFVVRDHYGRSPSREQVDDLKQELHNLKRNYAIILKENSVLKTRLKRCANELAKKEQQLQSVLLEQSRILTNEEQQAVINSMKQKIIKYEALIRDKSDEINRLKDDRKAMQISDLREQIASLDNERARLEKCINSAAPLSREQMLIHKEQVKRLNLAVHKLKDENEQLMSKLAKIYRDSEAATESLSSCDRADLIALIARLQMEAKRRSAALRNERMTSGVTRSGDRSVTNNEQQVARLTKELNQTRQLLKAKSVIIQKLRKDLKIVTCDKTTDNNKLKRITGQQNVPRSENNSGKKAVTKTKAVVGHSNMQKVNMGIKQTSENSCVDSIASDRDSPSPTLSGSSREQATTSASSISSRREASARNERPETSSTGVRRSASDSLSSSLGKRAEALRTTHAAKTIQKHWRGHKDTRAAVKSNPPGSSGGTAQIYLSAENVEAFEQKRAAKTIQKQWRNHKHHREAAQGSGTKENVGTVKQGNTSAEAKDVKAVTDDNEDNNSAEEERKSALDCVIDATLSHFTRLRLLDIKSIQLDVSHV